MTWRKENSVSWGGEGVGWGWRVEEGYNERLHTPCQVQSVSLQSQVRNLTVPDFQNPRRRYSLAVIWEGRSGPPSWLPVPQRKSSTFCILLLFLCSVACLPAWVTDRPTDSFLFVCLSIYLTDLIYLSALVPFCLSICLLSCGVCHAVLLSAMLPV